MLPGAVITGKSVSGTVRLLQRSHVYGYPKYQLSGSIGGVHSRSSVSPATDSRGPVPVWYPVTPGRRA